MTDETISLVQNFLRQWRMPLSYAKNDNASYTDAIAKKIEIVRVAFIGHQIVKSI